MAKDDKSLSLGYKLIIAIMGSFGLMLVTVAGIFIFVDRRTEVPADIIFFTIFSIWIAVTLKAHFKK